MIASRIQLPKNENPKDGELDEEDKNILAAFKIVFDGYRRAQDRTRTIIKAYNELESVALNLLKERYDNRNASSSSKIDVDDELADVLLVDLTSDFDFERDETAIDNLRNPSPIFRPQGNTSKKKNSFEEINSSKVVEASKSTKLEVVKYQHGNKIENKTTEDNEENSPPLDNNGVKTAAADSRDGEPRLHPNKSRPSVKLSLTKTAYKIEKNKAPSGKATKQSTLVFQPIAAKIDIGCSEKMKSMSNASRHWANLFDEDYRVKKSSNEKESTAATVKKDQLGVDKDKFDQSVKSLSKVVCDKVTIQKEQKPDRIIDKCMIMETPSQIDESARSLFEDEDLEDFQISQDFLNTCMDAPAPVVQPKDTNNFGKRRKINDTISSTPKVSQSLNGLYSIDETFFAPGEPHVPMNNAVKKPVEKAAPLAGCSSILTPKKAGDKDRALKRKSLDEPAEKDVLKDFDLTESDWDTDIWNDNYPPTERPLNNSFDIVPEKKNESSEYARNGKMGRNTDKMNKLPNWECWECEKYYDQMNLPKAELRRRMEACSRHKPKFPKYCTPKDFWNPDFTDTLDSSD